MDQAAETDRLRRGRLGRVREQLKARDLAACVLLNPVNVRYATGARNMQVFHARNGVGMTGEYPYILHAQDFASGYEGVIEPNMTLCVESYIGAGDGGEGVKLEEQVLVTESGVELLSRFPFDEALLGREV